MDTLFVVVGLALLIWAATNPWVFIPLGILAMAGIVWWIWKTDTAQVG